MSNPNLNQYSSTNSVHPYHQPSQYVDPNLTPVHSTSQLRQHPNMSTPQQFQYQSYPYIHHQQHPPNPNQPPLQQNQQIYYPQGTALPIQNPGQLQYQHHPYQNSFLIPTSLPVQSNNNLYIPQHEMVQPYYNQPLTSSAAAAPLLSSPVPIYNLPNSQVPMLASSNPSTSSSFPQTPVVSTLPGISSSSIHSVNRSSSSVSPLGSSSSTSKSSSKSRRKSKGSIPQPRKRTTRACDQCNHLRTKCDGKQPCSHCISVNLECQYLRIPLKRGKASIIYLESVKEKKIQEAKREAERARLKAENSAIKMDTLGTDPKHLFPLNHVDRQDHSAIPQNMDQTQPSYFGQYPTFQ